MADNNTGAKVCTKCGKEKSLDQFTKRKTGQRAGRYEELCKQCATLRAADYRRRNPEKVKQTQRAYYERNKEALSEAHRRRLADPEKRARKYAKTRAWRDANRDHIAAYNASRSKDYQARASRASRARHPERNAARAAVKNAIRRNEMPRASDLTCVHCGAQAQHYHHHKGYSEEHALDVIPVCTRCHGREHWVE